MTIATFLSRRRRALALCVATIVLHYMAIGWVGARIGPLPTASTSAPPAVMKAQLRLALPAAGLTAMPRPAPRPAPLKPKPMVQAASRPAPAPVATAEAAPEAAPKIAEASAEAFAEAAPPGDVQSGTPEAPALPVQPQSGAVLSQSAVESAQAGAGGDQVAPAEAARRYKVDLPESAEFALDVKRVDANGTVWNGVGAMSWQRGGGHYKMTAEAGLNALVTRINLLVLTSEGNIDGDGIAPVTATEKRKGRSQTATHFNRGQGRITFSASERSYPLPAGAQDKATLPFQLAGIGRSDLNQFAGNIDIFVGEDKEANVFRFVLVGEEELDTKMGRLLTWRLSRPPKPGTYSSRLDIWLAPGRGWYPVQIRNSEANGAVTTQTVSEITMHEPPGK